jgi:hypothetical protein
MNQNHVHEFPELFLPDEDILSYVGKDYIYMPDPQLDALIITKGGWYRNVAFPTMPVRVTRAYRLDNGLPVAEGVSINGLDCNNVELRNLVPPDALSSDEIKQRWLSFKSMLIRYGPKFFPFRFMPGMRVVFRPELFERGIMLRDTGCSDLEPGQTYRIGWTHRRQWLRLLGHKCWMYWEGVSKQK